MTPQVQSLINRFADRIDDVLGNMGYNTMNTNTVVVDQATLREMLYRNEVDGKFKMLCDSTTPFLTHHDYDMGECWIVIQNKDNVPIAVACFNGEDPDELEIDALEVNSDYRRKGIAREMVNLLHTIVEEVGITFITLEAFDTEAIKFWVSVGYNHENESSYFLTKKFDN